MLLAIILYFLSLSVTFQLPFFIISLTWWHSFLFHSENKQSEEKSQLPPWHLSTSLHLYPHALPCILLLWTNYAPTQSQHLLFYTKSHPFILTQVCPNIPLKILPSLFYSSVFPFILDLVHQHQACCNFPHLKTNKTDKNWNLHSSSYLQFKLAPHFCALIEKLSTALSVFMLKFLYSFSPEFSSMRFTTHCYTETVPVMDTSGLHAVRCSDPFLPLICLHLQHLTVDVAHLLEALASRTPCTHDFFSFSLTAFFCLLCLFILITPDKKPFILMPLLLG